MSFIQIKSKKTLLIRQFKLKLSKTQESILNSWIWNLTGVYNWAIRKIELDAKDSIYYSKLDFQNLLSGHSEKINIPSHVIQGTLVQAHTAWQRCFKKIAKKPKFKGNRNKLNSVPFPDPIKAPINNQIKLPYLGTVKFHKQSIPDAKIKCGRIVHRSSGWYLCLWLDCDNKFPVKPSNKKIGIDPGFSTLLTLSDGTKIENPKELSKGAKRLAQAQRGKNKQLVSRLYERQANRRQDRNHKISRRLIEEYDTIYYSKDNFSTMAKRFGKSVSQAGLGQLIEMIQYKGRIGGRKVIPINSEFTTMTCSSCRSLTGPKGMNELTVRHWDCACGAHHDRDINAAINILNVGAGSALKIFGNECN